MKEEQAGTDQSTVREEDFDLFEAEMDSDWEKGALIVPKAELETPIEPKPPTEAEMELERLKDELGQLRVELDRLRKELARKEREYEETLEVNRLLKDSLIRIEAEKRFLEGELQSVREELRKVKAELDKLRTPPLIIGTVKDLLADGRAVVKSTTGPDLVVNVAKYIDKDEMEPGTTVALNKQSMAIMSVLPSSRSPLISSAEIIEAPTTSYKDIGGLAEQINELRECVELPITKPELFKKVGIEPPRGVLLTGPPGTGKTLLAQAVAHETEATFIRLVGSELVQKFIGEGARLVRELFDLAREKAPSIIFIDEIDAIGAKRIDAGTSADREVQRTLMQLLAELDGFDLKGEIGLIAATNRPDILDQALLRPGRFDRMIRIPLPNLESRHEIFSIHTRKMNLSTTVRLAVLAKETEGMSGADIKAICTEAGMFAIRSNRDVVTGEDFQRALEKARASRNASQNKPEGAMFA